MERKVDEEFDFLGYTLKVEKHKSLHVCNGCFFWLNPCCLASIYLFVTGFCQSENRQDGNNVIFKNCNHARNTIQSKKERR